MNTIEKIRTEIESRVKSLEMPFGSQSVKEQLKEEGELRGYKDLLSFLDTLEKEQPSLPSDLDEAAIPESEMSEWMEYGPHTNYPWCSVPDAIKITAEHFFALGKQAGAEWMGEQGVTTEQTVGRTPLNGPNGVTVFLYDFDGFVPGDKVVVQIRKK